MVRRASRAFAAILLLLSMALTTAPVVSAHAADADGAGVCNGDVKIVVFDLVNQAGADDDFCFYAHAGFYLIPRQQDPNFNSNDPQTAEIPADDIGNRYGMNNFVSSISIRNDSTAWLCVKFYDSVNFDGFFTRYTTVAPGGHLHQNFFGGLGDNMYESMKVWLHTYEWLCP